MMLVSRPRAATVRPVRITIVSVGSMVILLEAVVVLAWVGLWRRRRLVEKGASGVGRVGRIGCRRRACGSVLAVRGSWVVELHSGGRLRIVLDRG